MKMKVKSSINIFAVILVFAASMIGVLMVNKTVYAADEIEINETNFPNAVFRAYVLEFYDKNKDSLLSPAEIEGADFLLLQGEEVSDLTGIEHLPYLIEISMIDTSLTEINLSQNIRLECLYCKNNLKLEKLDVTKNPKLKILECFVDPRMMEGWDAQTSEWYKGKLTVLDVSHNPELKTLNCFNNALTALDVTKNPKLEFLICTTNSDFENLDVSQNPELRTLSCGNLGLTKLDISHNLKLEQLECLGNNFTTVDVSKNSALKVFYCFNCQMPELDFSQNPLLSKIACQSGKISTLRLNPETYDTLVLSKIDLHGESTVLSELSNITEENGVLKVIDKTKPATYQYTYSYWAYGELLEGVADFTILYTDEPATPPDNLVFSSSERLFYDYKYTNSVSGSKIVLYGNGIVKKVGTTKTDNTSITLFTDILPSYNYTEVKGKIKAGMGKVVVGITTSDQKPSLTNGKIVDKTGANLAKATIKNGQITIKATGKKGGVAYLWVMDTGGQAISECYPLNIKLAPKKLEVQDAKGSKLKNLTITQGESAEVCIAGFSGNIKTEDGTYTATVDAASKNYVSIQQASDASHFTINATGLKNNKDTKVSITFTCEQNGKKVKFSVVLKKK